MDTDWGALFHGLQARESQLAQRLEHDQLQRRKKLLELCSRVDKREKDFEQLVLNLKKQEFYAKTQSQSQPQKKPQDSNVLESELLTCKAENHRLAEQHQLLQQQFDQALRIYQHQTQQQICEYVAQIEEGHKHIESLQLQLNSMVKSVPTVSDAETQSTDPVIRTAAPMVLLDTPGYEEDIRESLRPVMIIGIICRLFVLLFGALVVRWSFRYTLFSSCLTRGCGDTTCLVYFDDKWHQGYPVLPLIFWPPPVLLLVLLVRRHDLRLIKELPVRSLPLPCKVLIVPYFAVTTLYHISYPLALFTLLFRAFSPPHLGNAVIQLLPLCGLVLVFWAAIIELWFNTLCHTRLYRNSFLYLRPRMAKLPTGGPKPKRKGKAIAAVLIGLFLILAIAAVIIASFVPLDFLQRI